MRTSFFLILCLTTACAPFPSLEGRISDAAARADFPDLVPLAPILATAAAAGAAPTPIAGLEGRIAALQARAAALRGPIIDRTTRDRMRRGIAQGPLR